MTMRELPPVDDIRSMVQAGARFMDQQQPGWYLEIDVASLNIISPCQCIVGQTFGKFYLHATALARKIDPTIQDEDYWNSSEVRTVMAAHGFTTPDFVDGVTEKEWFKVLDELWLNEIKSRTDC